MTPRCAECGGDLDDGFCWECASGVDYQGLVPIRVTHDAPVLEEGTVVRLDNRDHVWHGEVAVIRAVRHKFYKIELLGLHTLVPHEWVKPYEPE